MKGASFGWALALPANIRLDLKGLPGTNTLPYYENLYITAVKGFIVLRLVGIIDPLHSHYRNKLACLSLKDDSALASHLRARPELTRLNHLLIYQTTIYKY
jgi:hypothetical protein